MTGFSGRVDEALRSAVELSQETIQKRYDRAGVAASPSGVGTSWPIPLFVCVYRLALFVFWSVFGPVQTRLGCLCRGSHAVGWCCTTGRQNAHGTEERELLYTWHPWAGRKVQIHDVIEKAGNENFRLSGAISGRGLEVPAWMFDRTICATWRVRRLRFFGQVDKLRLAGGERSQRWV